MNREGVKVAVIERKLVGGTCVNVGCIPTKALVTSARAAHMARRGADFGVMIQDPIHVDMKRVNAPDFPIGQFVLATVYEGQDRYEEAFQAFERAATVAPPWKRALGPAYARAGRTDEARASARRARGPESHSAERDVARPDPHGTGEQG